MAKGESGLKKDLDSKQLLLVVGLFLVLLVVVWFTFLRGGGEEPLPPPVSAPVDTSTAPETPGAESEETAEEPDEGRTETFQVFTRRDPFEPVVDTAPLGGSAPAPLTSGDTTGSTTNDNGVFTPGTDTSDTTTDTTTDTTGDTTDDTQAGPAPGQHTVRLVDVFRADGRRRAQVRVDTTVFIVDEGETFAENFRLLSIASGCASMLFGDEQFSLCEGDEVYK